MKRRNELLYLIFFLFLRSICLSSDRQQGNDARLNSLELSRIQQIIASTESEESLLTTMPEQTFATPADLNDSQNQILAQVFTLLNFILILFLVITSILCHINVL